MIANLPQSQRFPEAEPIQGKRGSTKSERLVCKSNSACVAASLLKALAIARLLKYSIGANRERER